MKLGQVTMGMLALLALLIAPLGEVAGQTPAQTANVTAATDVFAAGAPHGTWQKLIEPVRFYMAGVPAKTNDVETGGVANAALTYALPGTSQTARISSAGATFAMPADQAVRSEVSLPRIDVTFAAACTTALGGPLNPAFTITITGMDFNAQTAGVQSASASVAATGGGPSSAATYAHTFEFPAGLKMPAGTALSVKIAPGDDALTCNLQFARAASRVVVWSDSAAVNMWTASKSTPTVPGAFIRSLPHASKVLPAQRGFELHVAYTSAWPCLNGDEGNATTTACGGPDPKANLIDEMFASGRLDLRIRNVNTAQLQTIGATIDRSPPDLPPLGDSVEARRYSVTYDNSFQNGAYTSEAGAQPGLFAFELFSALGFVSSNTLAIGGKGFTFAPVGVADRNVNVGEPTTYRLLVTNTGTERDTITVSVSSDDATWKVNVLNGQVTVEPGSKAEVLVRVTPPTQGVPGAAVRLTATAVSSFPGEVSPISQQLSVTLVTLVSTGAVMTGPTTPLQVFAGDQLDLSGFKLRNTGSSVGTYVIETSYVPAAQGWRGDATPASRTIDAASVEDFSLRVNIGKNAAPGESHVLKIQARLLGGGVPDAAKLEIPISVIFQAGLDLAVRDEVRTVRDDTGATNPADTDNDQSVIFRVSVTNPTAVQQTFDVKSAWLKADGSADTISGTDPCTATHRGWSLSLWDGTQFPALAKAVTTSMTLQGNEQRDTYVVMQWNTGQPAGCARAATQHVSLSFKSREDTDFSTSISMGASIIGATTKTHLPTFESARLGDGTTQKSELGAVRQGTGFNAAKFQFAVINDGTELDSYTIELPPATIQGWTHTLAFKSANSVIHDGPGNPGAACQAPTSGGRVIRCNNVGVGDQLRFELTVQPPSNEALGRTMTSSIIITSLDQSEIKDFGEFRTRTVGQNDFALESLRGQPTTAAKGQTAALPFQIRNVGTANDGYTLALTGATSDTSAWKPRFSGSVGSQQEVSIPGGADHNGFLLVEAPSTGVTTNSEHSFTLQVTSKATGAKKSVTLTAKVVDTPTGAQISGKNGNNVLLAKPGQANDITVVFASSTACTATISADVDSLPAGWSVAIPTSKDTTLAGAGATKTGEVTFKMTPPADTLGTSNTAFRVSGKCPSGATAYTDLVLSVDVESGVDLALVSPGVQFVTPGGPTRWEMDVINTGLDRDTVSLTTSALPPGWSVTFEAKQMSIGPIDTVRTTFDVNAPANAAPKSNVTFNVLATSQTDSSVIKQVKVSAVVGFREIMVAPAATTLDGAPEQSVSFTVPVTNAGTLPDKVRLVATVETPGYETQVQPRVQPGTVDLLKGQVRDAVVTVDLGRTVPADVDISIKLVASSLFNPAINVTQQLTVHVLRFERADIDGDLVDEYAIDANKDLTDGFEVFRDSSAPGGRQTTSADLVRFLNAAGKAALEAANRTTPFIDGDKDGKRDHFLDDTGDGLPNIYWDPDGKFSQRLSVAKDVDADAVIDYFVDTNNDGRLDRLYNVVTGKWTPLIAIDGANGRVSYIVDRNENGQADADESVLVVALGRVASVTLKVDVDGDGKLDTVVDEDGDGKPDYFIRAGESRERRIFLQDVNGDGIEDWTYDSNLDGRPDAFYDPVTKSGGHEIDRAAHFGDLVKTYWYVPVLFVLVVGLFIVLVAVTRR